MHPVEFLYWFMGAIRLGNLALLEVNSPCFLTVIEHIELVKDRNRLQILIGQDCNLKDIEYEKELYDYVLLIESDLRGNNQDIKSLELIAFKISEIVNGFYYDRKNQMLYYLQGAFELTNLSKIKINHEVIFKFSSDFKMRKELLFYFKLTGCEFIDGRALDNLKALVDRALWTAC
jgi:hypothetical protein